ncbi:MAG TPA: septal ring lytic transglycosylase RlpA family protein [Gemmatimonadaceae bacterium]|nr:septal ring lytic transglycosylase RlpA family protein [Gemmatimonadaceae bacterium]
MTCSQYAPTLATLRIAIAFGATFALACGGRRDGLGGGGSSPIRVSETGVASWYGPGFHGKPTASGEPFDQNDLTAAHRTLPLGTRVAVTNLGNGMTVRVRINDRGPFARDRIIDLSRAAAERISMIGPGTARVRVDVLDSPVRVDSIRAAVLYTLQLGSFSDRDNAERLRERAAAFGDAAVVPVRLRNSTVYRVQVGAFTTRAQAESEAQSVRQAGHQVVIVEK